MYSLFSACFGFFQCYSVSNLFSVCGVCVDCSSRFRCIQCFQLISAFFGGLVFQDFIVGALSV